MSYTVNRIKDIIGARLHGRGDAVIDCLLTDSRSLSFASETLFFCLRSAHGNGENYVPELYDAGVRNFVVSESFDMDAAYQDASYLQVSDVLEALQKLASEHRNAFRIPVVGITGSNGKTIVKEWLNHLLRDAFSIVRSPRSYNSQIGVPLSVWQMQEKDELAIFEAGISQAGEMERVERIIRPTIGVFTNLGGAHQENFSSLRQKCLEKLRLFKDSGLIIYCKDDDLLQECMTSRYPDSRLMGYSRTDQGAALFIREVEKESSSSTVTYTYKGRESRYHIPFANDALIEDSILCLATGLALGASPEMIEKGMQGLQPLAMRLEVMEGMNGCQIVNDSYSLDFASLDIALDFLSRRVSGKALKPTLVLSDFMESGRMSAELYREVARLLERRGLHRLIGVGPEITANAREFHMERTFFPSTEALLQAYQEGRFTFSSEMILINGARAFRLERLSEMIAKKVHETTMEINLSALAQNVDYYRNFLRPETKMVCMVKASAYGCGAVEVSRTLQDKGVEYLAVAVADEGAELRNSGIRTHIMVMNPEFSAFKTIFDYHLEPEIYSFSLLEAFITAARREGITHYPVHLKLDTGMHRLGFAPGEIQGLVDLLLRQDAVMPVSVFSHFVGSDSSQFDEFTKKQIAIFDESSAQIVSRFPHRILRHICNSAGIERCSDVQYEMVRLGLGLYGIDPIDNRVLHNVSTLKTTILQIHDVPADETVGYSRRGVLSRDSRIASIPIGYADGLNRHLGRGNCYCLVGGRKAPYVGNICMDVCMIDVTDIDCKEGDSVEIFGENLPVTVLSDVLDTIPYEVLTGISTRVKRVYYQE